MIKVKGSVLNARKGFIKKKCTPQQEEVFVKELSPEARKTYEMQTVPAVWYDYNHYHEINAALVKVIGKGDKTILREAAAFASEMNVKGIYRVIFLVASPEQIVRKAVTIWNQHYSSGTVSCENEKGKAVLSVRDFEGPLWDLEEILIGWIKKLLELCGGKNVVIKILSPAERDPKLQIVVQATWD